MGPSPAIRAETEQLLDSAPDAIVISDESGTIRLVNRQAEVLFGYDREELIGQVIDQLVPTGIAARHPKHRAGYFEHPVSRPMGAEVDLRARRKDGSEVPVDISLSSLETDDGLLVSAAVRDITDRKRTEARFQALLDTAPDAIVAVDADGVIQLVNRQAEALFGYHRDELLGQVMEVLVPERARLAHPAHRTGYAESPETRPMGAGLELAARRRDGTEFPVDISLSSLETDEGLLVSAAVRDITDRKRSEAERAALEDRLRRAELEEQRAALEKRIHQSQRLESIGQLAGGIAHDFNNLLAGIMNYAGLVVDGLADAIAEHDGAEELGLVQDDAREIVSVSRRAADLVHQLLIFSRREVANPEVLDLNVVISDMERLLVRTIGEDVDLRTGCHPGLPLTKIDRGQLEQVVMNLVVNGRDAMPGGGRLELSTSEFRVDEEFAATRPIEPGAFVRLTVSDTGEGMPPDVVDRAFEPFFSTKPKDKGTGLGLATVYGIVTQAGGDVSIYSEAGLGTTVRVILPVTAEHPERRAAQGRVGVGDGDETILLVEDEEIVREPARRLLARRGYRVLAAAEADEALRVAAAHDGPIDLLLTDVVMPGRSGRDLAEAIAEVRPEIRVLFMSGYSQDVIAHQGVLEEGVNLVEKPFVAETLLVAVRKILDEGGGRARA